MTPPTRLVLAYTHEGMPSSLGGIGDGYVVAITEAGEGFDWPGIVEAPVEPCFDSTAEVARFIARHAGPSDIIVPMIEETIPACGLASLMSGAVAGTTYEKAIRVLDRGVQRRLLEPTGLNPRWTLDGPLSGAERVVVKAPASLLSEGVEFPSSPDDLFEDVLRVRDGMVREPNNPNALDYNSQLARFVSMGATPSCSYMVEEYVEGLQFEVDGVSGEDPLEPLHLFRPVRQRWSRLGDAEGREVDGRGGGGVITSYEPVRGAQAAELREVARTAVAALGLTWCGWNVEIRGRPGAWKVVEVNGRLGEDSAEFEELVSPTISPTKRLVELLVEEVKKSRPPAELC